MLISLFFSIIFAISPLFAFQSVNSIEGRVTGPDNRPLQNVRVLLQDDSYAQIQMAYTDGAGRFRFQGIPRGIYNIQVEPGQYNYDRQSARLDVNPISGRRAGVAGSSGGGEIFRQDFVLRSSNPINPDRDPAGSVFAQAVPETARKEYANAVKSLDKSDFDVAAQSLKQAITLFPDYYDALELLGTEYVKHRDYQAALPVLSHAVEVNDKGWRGYYSLGVAYSELKQPAESVKALKRATELNPGSTNAYMRLGIELAKSAQSIPEAIVALKKVTQLAGNSIPEAYLYLGALYNKTNQYSEAAKAFEDFLKAAPDAGEKEKIKQIIKDMREKAKKS
jgi:tetratricopeptide (TPR) repeat protein